MGRFGITTFSPEETIQVARQFAKQLKTPAVLCFFGNLAAGKTTFIKGIVSELTKIDPEQVNSPTFSLLNIYEGKTDVYHFDLYRLKGPDDFFNLGFDEYLDKKGVCCIEWSERIASVLPESTYKIHLEPLNENERRIEIQ